MDRQAFREKLQRALRGTLATTVQRHLDQRFEAHQQLLRYISAVDRKYTYSEVIGEGLPGILGNMSDGLEKTPEEGIADLYLSAVDRLADQFPEEIVWVQEEDRFTIQDNDSLLISAGKRGKRSIRAVARGWHNAAQKISGSDEGWESWTQTVPLRRLIQFHLQDEEIVSEWVHMLERIQLRLITRIENLLVARGKPDGKIELPHFVASLDQMLDSKKDALEQKLMGAINEIESEIQWKVKKVGTVEQRSSFYNEQRLTSNRKKFRNQIHSIQDQWGHVHKSLLNRNKDIARFLKLGEGIEQQSHDFTSDFCSTLTENLDQPLRELSEILDDAIHQIGQGNSLENVLDLKTYLGTFVEERLTTPIQKLLNNQVLTRKVEHFFEDLLMSTNQAPQQAMLIFDAELEKDPPTVNQKQMEWQQLVIRALREHVMTPLQPNQQKYEGFLAETLEDIHEVENIIDVNLESALSVEEDYSSDEGGEDPAAIAREALKRISTNIEELRSRSTEKRTDIEENISEGTEKFIQSLLQLIHEGDAKELQLLNAKYRVKETTKDWRTVWDSRFVRAQDRLLLWSRFGWKKMREYSSNVKAFAGFKDQEIEELRRADIATYLSETDQKLRELPYIYRRLFDFSALADERFYVSPPESLMTFKKAFEQWQQSLPATFAVVGEKGSGKSTFLNMLLESQLDQNKTIQINLKDTIWTEHDLVKRIAAGLELSGADEVREIVDAINNSSDRKVVILEGLQNCFVRNINGYEAIEKLSFLISETQGNIFWMVSCSRYAWRFLDKTMQISEYFSHTAMSDVLDAEQIKSVILNRHRSSGYTLVFEPGSETLKSRAYRKLKDKEEQAQEYLKKNYFQKLTDLAEGNASVAMIFWIRSIREFDDTYFYIKPLEITSIEMIEDFNPQVLFTLATFVIHDTLSDEDLSMVLNTSIEESRLLLNRLRSRGLLEQKEETLTLNHFIYRQIVRVLKERNIIHLV